MRMRRRRTMRRKEKKKDEEGKGGRRLNGVKPFFPFFELRVPKRQRVEKKVPTSKSGVIERQREAMGERVNE